jgi:hypothetical protein
MSASPPSDGLSALPPGSDAGAVDDAMSDVSVDEAEVIAPALLQRLARDATGLTQEEEAADTGEEQEESEDDQEDQLEDTMALADCRAYLSDKSEILMAILDEADVDVLAHEAMANVIADGDNPADLQSQSIDSFRKIVNGYRVEGSQEQREWIRIISAYQQMEAKELAEEGRHYYANDDIADRDNDNPRPGLLGWAEDQLETAEDVLGAPIRWGRVEAYLPQFTKSDARHIREFLALEGVQPEGTLLDWVQKDKREDDPTTETQHAYSLVLHLIIQMADEECEVYEEQLDKRDEVTRGIKLLGDNLLKLIRHIDPQSADWPEVPGAEIPRSEAGPSGQSLEDLAAALTVDTMGLVEERNRIVEHHAALKTKDDAEWLQRKGEVRRQNAPAASPSATPSDASSSTPADDMAVDVAARRRFLAEAHQRVLELLESEDVPVRAPGVWADCLRTTAVILEQGYSFTHIIPPSTFERLVREVAAEFKDDLEFEPEAISMLQEAAEQMVVKRFDAAGAQVDAVRQLGHWSAEDMEDVPLHSIPRPAINAISVFSEHARLLAPAEYQTKPPPSTSRIGGGVGVGMAMGFGQGSFGSSSATSFFQSPGSYPSSVFGTNNGGFGHATGAFGGMVGGAVFPGGFNSGAPQWVPPPAAAAPAAFTGFTFQPFESTAAPSAGGFGFGFQAPPQAQQTAAPMFGAAPSPSLFGLGSSQAPAPQQDASSNAASPSQP